MTKEELIFNENHPYQCPVNCCHQRFKTKQELNFHLKHDKVCKLYSKKILESAKRKVKILK